MFNLYAGVPALETSQNNKQIIFKTVSATPVIEEMSNRLPSTAPDTSSTARSIARYSGLANIDQEMAHIPSLQSLLNMPQQGNVREMPNARNVFRFQQMPNLRQFTSTKQALDIPSRQLMSSMQFLKPGMGSMPQGEQQETYENGGKTIHVQGDNDIGFTPWSDWTHCSASCGRGIKTRSRSCISAFNAVGIDNSCLGPKVQTRRCRIRRCPGEVALFQELNRQQVNRWYILIKNKFFIHILHTLLNLSPGAFHGQEI